VDKMKILAIIIVVILVYPGFVAAVDPADPTGLPAASESQEVRLYTGIIKNKTRYEVAIPSKNSDATLLIPAYGWIEYTIWAQHANITAYHDGKPFYCLNIFAHPQEYPFMCKKYDFMAEIIAPEPVRRYQPIPKKRPVKQKPQCDQGVEALG
jgi:hypothetical protein